MPLFSSLSETGETTLNASELFAQAALIAANLRRTADRGSRARLVYQPGLEFIAAFFGCLAAGVIAVPVYPPGKHIRSF